MILMYVKKNEKPESTITVPIATKHGSRMLTNLKGSYS